jgi:hypothetical protein
MFPARLAKLATIWPLVTAPKSIDWAARPPAVVNSRAVAKKRIRGSFAADAEARFLGGRFAAGLRALLEVIGS